MPYSTKVKAINEMPNPTAKTGVMRFLGMVNYLSSYIPNKSEITRPLRELLKEDSVWHWGEAHDKAVQNLKQILSTEPVLRYYDCNKKLVIQADASKHGLGACLMQEKQPIAYASRALTTTELQYAQIEKELFAIVFAAEKFHHYVYGVQVGNIRILEI
jgi:hypothetical protein